MLLFDYSQYIHGSIYSIKQDMIKHGLDKTINFLKHRILTSILYAAKKYKNHREIVLCADSKNNWRKDIHPHYKGRRKLRRIDDDFPWAEFWTHMKTFNEEIEKYIPFNLISVNKAEGDDIIATLTFYVSKTRPHEDIVIISNDKDFKQLLFNDKITLFDQKKNKEVTVDNYKNYLMFHILKGDDSDDILNVKTTDLDTFMNPDKKQITMWRSTKIWEHINNNTVMDELLVDLYRKNKKTKKNELIVTKEQLLKNFERNRTLVDLRKIPIYIQKEIIMKYETQRKIVTDKGQMDLLKYFINQKMRVMSDRIEDYSKYFKMNDKESTGILDYL